MIGLRRAVCIRLNVQLTGGLTSEESKNTSFWLNILIVWGIERKRPTQFGSGFEISACTIIMY
jgi:hypothetical protein